MSKLVKGILIGVVAVVVLLGIAIGVVIGIGMFGWKDAVRKTNEEVAVLHINTIVTRQVQYLTENGKYATFDQLIEEGKLDTRFAGDAPRVDGYVYVLKIQPASAGQKSSFTLNADPESPDTGTRHFMIDDKNPSVRYNSNQPARAGDPLVEK